MSGSELATLDRERSQAFAVYLSQRRKTILGSALIISLASLALGIPYVGFLCMCVQWGYIRVIWTPYVPSVPEFAWREARNSLVATIVFGAIGYALVSWNSLVTFLFIALQYDAAACLGRLLYVAVYRHYFCDRAHIVPAPGSWLYQLADLLFSEKDLEQVYKPWLADYQHEYFQVLQSGRIHKARFVRIRHTWAFLQTVTSHTIGNLIRDAIRLGSED